MTTLTRFLNSLFFFIILCSNTFAGETINPQTGVLDSCITIEEEDGSPSNAQCWPVKVTNGTLTDNTGSFSLTTGGGGGAGDIEGVTAGAGLGGGGTTGTVSLNTDSSEAAFLASGALTCGAGTAGKVQVHTTPLQYCDNAATPALQYAAYGSSTGVATSTTSDSTWTSHNSYPAACAASNWMTTIGDTVTCSQPAFTDISGAATDGQVPNTITVDLATTATTANAGDSATAFFSTGTLEVAIGGTGTTTSTGTGAVVLGTSPTFTTGLTIPVGGLTDNSIVDGDLATTESINLPIYSAKLTGAFVVFTPPTADACTQGAQIDAGDGNWRLLFDPTTDECATWQFVLPDYWAAHSELKIFYSMTSATANEVDFEAAVMCVTPGDAADIGTAGFANVATASDTVPGTAGFPDSVSITITDDACAAGDVMFVVISKDANDATLDDATGDTEIVGVVYESTR